MITEEKLNKLKGILEGLKESFGQTEEKVIKTIQLTPEEKKKYEALKKTRKEYDLLGDKCEAMKRSFWSGIELRTNEFKNMRISEKDNSVVEVFE